MKKIIFSKFGLIILAGLLVVAVAVSNLLFKSVRLDLTEDNLYTLSDGTKNIVRNMDKALTLKYFFSDKATKEVPQIRSYAKRVEELLEEYAAVSGGNVSLDVIDPEPFSEEEDLATEFGLQGVPLGNGDSIYMGLAAVDGQGAAEVIPFFQPDREAFLEYDVSKALYSLGQATAPKVGLISGLPVMGQANFQTGQPGQPWMVISQLQELFNVQDLGTNFESLDQEFELLVVIHPKNLGDKQKAALDQFALKGGRLLIFVDPFAEQDGAGQQAFAQAQSEEKNSELDNLFKAWGIELVKDKVLADVDSAIQVGDQFGRRIRHVGLYTYDEQHFDRDTVMMADLESINLGSAGVLTSLDDASTQTSTEISPLIQSGLKAALIDSAQFQYLVDPKALMQNYSPKGEALTVAARISGAANTAYPDGIEGTKTEGWVDTGEINVVVVADTDLLADRMWVRVQRFFGQQVAQPFADNGGFVINTVETLLGSSDLIDVRSRGSYVRVFDRVEDIQRDAEARFRQKEDELNAKLQSAEQRIYQLENQKDNNDQPLVLNSEQQAELDQMRKDKIDTRKALRHVQHQLNKDIEQLGMNLKLINILLVPILLIITTLVMQRRRKR